jgi:Cytochrome c7 and related cytochrome c
MPGFIKTVTIPAIGLLIFLVSQVSAGVDGLQFDHRLHIEDAELACADCHAFALTQEPSPTERPVSKQSCADCHDVEDQSACNTCHSNDDYSIRRDQQLIAGFSHLNHACRKLDCSLCHSGIATSKTLAKLPNPDTGACSDCHMGSKIKAPNHTTNWEHTHALQTELNGKSCILCHVEQQECNTCHEGDNMLTENSPHPLAYLYSHGSDARVESPRCQSCHQDQLYCIECHSSFSVKPLSHDKAGWLTCAHGGEAKLDLGNCILCHGEAQAAVLCGSCHN